MKVTTVSQIKLTALITLIAGAIAISALVSPRANMAPKAAPVVEKALLDAGSDYATNCARCHGNDGRGQTAKGRQTHAGDLTKSSISDAKGIRMITNGSGDMPAFKGNMSAEQIRGVMAYVRGFRR